MSPLNKKILKDMVIDFIPFAVFIVVVLVMGFAADCRSWEGTGTGLIGEKTQEALNAAQAEYPGYEFEMSAVSVGRNGEDVVVLYRDPDGNWTKLASSISKKDD